MANEHLSIDPCQHEWAAVLDGERTCLKCGVLNTECKRDPTCYKVDGHEGECDDFPFCGKFWRCGHGTAPLKGGCWKCAITNPIGFMRWHGWIKR